MPEQPEPRREASDLFSVHGARGEAIPTITAIPRTKEEIRRRRVLRLTWGSIAAVVAVLLAAAIVYWHGRSAIESARLAVEEDARPATIDGALALLDGATSPADVALAARIHATAELQGIAGHRSPAEQLLAGHDPAGDGASDHRIAVAYLALASGDAARAAEAASPLAVQGPRAAESGYARALVELAIGSVPAALADARAAAQAAPGSPRLAAMLALASSRAGEAAPLEGDSIPMRLARGRVHWAAGERSGIGADVEPVRTDEAAAPAERAWAHLLAGLGAIDAGDTVAASAALTTAAEAPPPGDEAFRLTLAEAWLVVGRRSDAQALLAALPATVSTDAARRTQLQAELHLAAGELAAAETALGAAPAGPRTAYLRGRLADARGQADAARPLYEEAARAPALRVEATVALAAMLSRTGHATQAVGLVEPMLAQHATHPRVAAAAVDAFGAAGNRVRALEVARTALGAHARDPLVLAAQARVHLEASEWQPALDALRIATEVEPRDATLQTQRGRAARQLGQLDEARHAFEAAIAVDPAALEALRSLLAIQLETHDLDGAQATLARIDTARATDLEIERMRAHFLVDTMAGASGFDAVRRARRTARRDRELAFWLGRLQMQAEEWYEAIESFDAAMPPEGDAGRRDVQLWRLMAFARAGRDSTVEQIAESMREAAAEAPLSPIEEARLVAAEAWVAFVKNLMPRALGLARRARELDGHNAYALLLVAAGDELQHRDPTTRLQAALEGTPPAIEAAGRLATVGPPSPEKCALGRRYLRAAPRGALAAAVRERIATCPPE